MNDVWPAMYSAALLPSRWRAAVAKKRSWSTIGGISSERVSSIGLPVFSTSSAISSSPRASTASAMRNRASDRSDGVESRQPSKASAAACIAASTSAPDDSGAVGVLLAGDRIDDGGRATVGRTDVRAVDEVRECPHGRFVSRAPSEGIPAPPTIGPVSEAIRTTGAAIRTVGVPREIKTAEHRVAMTPDGVRELERHGDPGARRDRAPARARRSRDADYVAAGADIVADRRATRGRQEMVVKVKEPKEEEFALPARRPDAVHVPPPRRLPGGGQGAAWRPARPALAYETVQLADGALPLLAPMSEVAGRLAPQRAPTSSSATTAGGAC